MQGAAWIAGRWETDGEALLVRDPYRDRPVGTVPHCRPERVDAAVGAAAAAFPAWSEAPAWRRAAVLERATALLGREAEALAVLLVAEAGKPIRYARAEVARAIETFRLSTEEARRIHGETVPLDAVPAGDGRVGFWWRVPVGIVAAISPFNFPLNLVAHKVGPALAAGCTVVLKPASATPLSAWRLACLLEEAGLPPGVLNVVYGEGATVGERLVADPRVAAVSFTGSAAVGRRIAALAAPRRVVLELGGNCGVLLDADTDLARAVPRCVESAFAHAGQVCISLQRIYVHAALAEPFTAAFLEAAAQVVAGDPADPATVAGPMIRPAEAERAVAWVEEARAAGARVLLGGGREGALMAPTVLDRVAPEMRVVRDEVFAPVVTIASVPDFEEGLRQLGDSAFGLQAGVYTRDLGRALSAARRLDVGGVMVNDTPIFRVDHMPYGGNRGSGLGREGVRFAVEEYTTPRMVVIDPR